ncbi:hypothetical protein LCGC14_0312840 [marine sediment metagenome]|uniref:Uncharacterized protein n=1 Tax=marine sediment metagenome TaxID=412755 RepID=A0A0F9U3Y0_9ZZZZ
MGVYSCRGCGGIIYSDERRIQHAPRQNYHLVCHKRMLARKQARAQASKCPGHLRHWFTASVGDRLSHCSRCGAPNPSMRVGALEP